ncbi:fimbrial protein [Novilysobacter spongiicola]|uniref:Major type 1 subunit fimbrin (Pilin) n=1 Tax=Lysobacter spongiicola DSM 21749 TaxID=1122188 RepID=A0A1T4RVK6_9GAMM|nr:fimbrial protein [Lysobacter spongiicola]SKA20020.1 major type 1 subunit fimbrin (pilin) [Lysobacter spongiicola DSM 21749]
MRKSIVLAAGLTAAVLAPLSASAADGTITFNGEVTAQTCDITTPGGEDFTVTLPTVASSALATAGQTAGRTGFAITLANCPTGGDVATYFEPGATVDNDSGRLNNQGTAGNVQVQLLGDNGQLIPVQASGTAQANSQWVTVAGDGSANLDYAAEYYATGAATAGGVTTSVAYTIIYN